MAEESGTRWRDKAREIGGFGKNPFTFSKIDTDFTLRIEVIQSIGE